MNQSEAAAFLEKFQEEFNIDQVTYNNKNVWPILRYYMALVLMKQEEKKNETAKQEMPAVSPAKRSNIIGALKNIFRGKEYSDQKNAFAGRGAEIVFISPSFESYPDVIDGKHYSRYLDPYFETFSGTGKVVKLQLTTDADSKKNTFIPVQTINETAFFESKSLSIKLSRRMHWKQRNQARRVLKQLNTFAKKNNIPYTFNSWLLNHLDEVNDYEKLFTDIFKGSSTRVVFFECYYSPCLFGLISACKKQGIKTVDIQHGNVDINYLAWKNISANVSHFLPDYYWVWSSADFELVADANNASGMKPVTGGNMWLRKASSSGTISSSLQSLSSGYRKKILVSLQYSFFLSYTVKLIADTITNDGQDFFWMIRFHPLNTPAEKAETISTLGNFPNVEFEQTSAANLYSILKYADVHIVASSATAKEGLQVGVTTIIVHEQGKDLFKDLIEEGIFCAALTPPDLLNRIKNFIPSSASGKFRMETSASNALTSLEQIISAAA